MLQLPSFFSKTNESSPPLLTTTKAHQMLAGVSFICVKGGDKIRQWSSFLYEHFSSLFSYKKWVVCLSVHCMHFLITSMHFNTASVTFRYISTSPSDVQKFTWRVPNPKPERCQSNRSWKLHFSSPVFTEGRASRCCQNTHSHHSLPRLWSKWHLLRHPLIRCHEVTTSRSVIFNPLKPDH